MIIVMKAIEQYIHVVLFIMLCKDVEGLEQCVTDLAINKARDYVDSPLLWSRTRV